MIQIDVVLIVLKIWGIYTHAQIDERFWSSIASQSQKRGKEYRRRLVTHSDLLPLFIICLLQMFGKSNTEESRRVLYHPSGVSLPIG